MVDEVDENNQVDQDTERQLRLTLAARSAPGEEESVQRINRVLTRARRQLALRDLITFGYLRTLTTLVAIAAAIYATFTKRQTRSNHYAV